MEKIQVKLTDKFWLRYRELVRKEMIPYQWAVLNDAIDIHIEKERNDMSIPSEKSHAIENFKIAAGRSSGAHYGWVFQDSDVYKWLEAVAYLLREKMEPQLKEIADGVVDLIADAQEEDGYLGTYFTIMEPERRFKRLGESHELYCAGHFMEAAVAYYTATGNQKVLETACRLADCIDRSFGAEEGKIHGCDGHEEVEIGLMRLYEVTEEARYLKLAEYFLQVRGEDKDFFKKQWEADKNKKPLIQGMTQAPYSYFQVHRQPILQDTAEGHAVRLVYLCMAMANVAADTKNDRLFEACRKIWRNIVDKRMYITGGIGATVSGEAFTLDYDLPNDTMYCETCASIGLIFFARQMLKNEADGEYADVMERALYNTVLAGMALDGKHFFYVNPLETVPEKSKKDPGKSHVKCIRPQWLGCACCPPNLARLLTSVEDYVYTVREDALLVNLFMESELEIDSPSGTVTIAQTTGYPQDGDVTIKACGAVTGQKIGIRIPAWASGYTVTVNGRPYAGEPEHGFLYVTREQTEDVIELHIKMEVQRWHANPHVSEDIGKTAITRGPLVYCMEAVDNGSELHLLSIAEDTEFTYTKTEQLGGVGVITADGMRKEPLEEEMPLYRSNAPYYREQAQKLTWIPYYAWANRGESEMAVWIREE